MSSAACGTRHLLWWGLHVRADLTASELLAALANGIALTTTDAAQAKRLVLLIRQGTDTPSTPDDNIC
ncbi:hypothetical protein [Actinocatenispora rupis]|uniref:Uncharacterized protein n=1 Tax=Actinocatenispora rupis TaxID=519421 RepID=A0A8J3NAH7_9ACTN|nr:hypothetical protein [Actinocatenispora rupis]GID12379.1 hypothetical protein Aru02nite_32680 [Actinocatenispora rupis]